MRICEDGWIFIGGICEGKCIEYNGTLWSKTWSNWFDHSRDQKSS